MKKYALIAAVVAAFALLFSSCDDSKSYAEYLNDQDMAVNNYLADNTVILDIPEDSVFISGPDAPFYRMDEDGEIYMRVIKPGTKGNMVQDNEQVYFRYTRWNLLNYSNGKLPDGEGNNISLSPCWFRYNNYQIESSYTWGYGVQFPLSYLPLDCEVLVVIKAQMGPTNEQSDVVPYLWQLTYQTRQ